ncbi:MAG: cyclic nucleotide-binding domain-containing protein, partial [Bacteroidales bacterium]
MSEQFSLFLKTNKRVLDTFYELSEELVIPTKTTLLEAGDISSHLYFIEKGCLRLWFNHEGKDITFQFFFEGCVVCSIESFYKGIPG